MSPSASIPSQSKGFPSSSRGHARGFTLPELLVAITVTAVVLAGVCGVFTLTAREWEHQQGSANALVTTSTACSRLADYLSQACGVQVLTRFTSGDTIAVNMPSDKVYTTVYAPLWNGGEFEYRSGSWLIFYLSDSSGNYAQSGNILWAAAMSWTGFPGSVVPDSSWSMYYGGQKGRIAPIKTLAFTLDSAGDRPTLTVTATVQYRLGVTTAQLAQTRTVCLRNYNSLGASPPD